MAQHIINSRVILRNDVLSNWNKSEKKLLKGEMALALHTEGEYKDKYEIRIGDGTNKFSGLAPTNIVIPYTAISGMPAAAEYTLSVSTDGLSACVAKGDIAAGAVFSVKGLSDAITAVAGDVGQLCTTVTTTISNAITGISNEISAPATGLSAKVTSISTDIYTAGTGLSAQVDALKNSTARGVNFVGHVSATTDGDNATYTLSGQTSATPAKAGNLVIKDGVEYIFSDTTKKWEQFGDEGNTATKAYVDTTKAAAISATQNAIHVENDLTDEAVAAYHQSEGDVNVIGDVLINKKTIASGETSKQYTAYVWNGTVWTAMDGNYSAKNIIMPDDMTITYQLGKYTIPSSGSKVITCAGMDLKSFLDDAFAETKSGTVTLPTFTFSAGGDKIAEIGTTYVLPAATLKMTGVGAYQYGPETGITVPAGSAEVSCTTAGFTAKKSNSDAMTLNSTLATDAGTVAITYLSGGATYRYGAHATYTQGAVPKNNIGGNDPDKQIASALCSLTCSAKFTGVYPAYYGFTTSPKANPTAITATNGDVSIDGITYKRDLNVFNKTSFTASSTWYELFYMIPKGKHSSWSGKDSNNVDLAVGAKSEATITFLDGSTATYEVFVVRNAAQYSATTCTMKWA